MMKQLPFIPFLLLLACSVKSDADEGRLKELASRVTIIRDSWGIPHIYGKTDADVVFGLMYAQCEDNFEKVERAYIEKMGRLSEVEGEGRLLEDMRTRLIFDTSAAIADFNKSPAWLKALLQAFADGINYYLSVHPNVQPRILQHFEPWFPLLFTDGGYTALQTGGLEAKDIKNLYDSSSTSTSSISLQTFPPINMDGSNGFAIAPSKTASGNALLYINPHVSFYFRTEAHLVSEEGLNAYGAVTWGQFFVFQGFNEHCGWMHTASMADAADLYEEKISRKNDTLFYEYAGTFKKINQKQHQLYYQKKGERLPYHFTAYYTHHGPVVGKRNGKWLSLKEQNRSLNSLIQSWQRTKAKNYEEFASIMQLRSNCATNTVYADDKGTIAYWHGNFIPARNVAYNWSKPVDGSIAGTEWKGLHGLNEIVHVFNPKSGWIQNCNSTPFSAAGFNTIQSESYPVYMAPEGENFRSLLAIKELQKGTAFTLDKLIELGYSPYLPLFDTLLPSLLAAYDALPLSHPFQATIKEPIHLLKAWDRKAAVNSIATTLAIEWAYNVIYSGYAAASSEAGTDQVLLVSSIGRNTAAEKKLALLAAVIKNLEKNFGTWQVPWGDINRYQRNAKTIFDDGKESLPVSMASAFFGSLPAFETVWNQTSKGYGVAGNSFTAAVEFGKKIKAKAISTGGQSFDPFSKHYMDQAKMYTEGRFRDVWFYKDDVVKHAEKTYHPGEE